MESFLFVGDKRVALRDRGSWALGCYSSSTVLDNIQDVQIPGDVENLYAGTSTRQTSCNVKCASISTPQKYALVSASGVCLCTSSINTFTAVASNLCDAKVCNFTSDANECDGDTYYSAFNTSLQLTGVKLTNTQTLHGMTVQNITAEATPANFPNTMFSFDFGDNTASAYVSSNIYRYLYINAGYYLARVYAKTATVNVTSDRKLLHVVVPPNGIFFDVPIVFESKIQVEYTVLVREGTNMTLSVESPGGTLSVTLSDPSILQSGVSVETLLSGSLVLSNSNTVTYIMPKTAFATVGIVSGFELLVSKAGYLRLQVFRPVCASFASSTYCYDYMNCTTLSCPSHDMLSTSQSTSTQFGSVAPADYKLISEIVFLLNFTGYTYLKVKASDMRVQKGDMIGMKLSSTGGDISHVVSNLYTEYAYSSPPNAFPGSNYISANSQRKSLQHSLRVHISTTSIAKKTSNFPNAGIFTLKATATNSIGTHQQTKQVHVQDRIIGFKLTIPEPFTSKAYAYNKAIAITTTTTQGSNITYEWVIKYDGKNFTSNSTKTLSYSPPQPGMYTVFAKGSNLINTDNDTVIFEVLEEIEQLILNSTNGKLLTPAGKKFNVTVAVVKGTNVTLTAKLGADPEKSYFIPNASPIFPHTFQFDVPSCSQPTLIVKAQNRVSVSPKTQTANVDILCPIAGLKVVATPMFSTVAGQSQVTLQTKTTVQLAVSIQQGSFVTYRFENGVDSNHQNKDHSTLLTPKAVIFYFKYTTTGTFNARINVKNSVSEESFAFKVIVTDCPAPVLTITGSPQVNNPTFVTRGEDYTVKGSLKSANCTVSNTITYTALLYKVGNSTALDTKTMTYDKLKYVVAKGTVPAGKYKVVFRQIVQTDKGNEKTELEAYVVVKQSDLVASIKSGSSRTIPIKTRPSASANYTVFYEVVLDASSSYDPDVETTTNLKYEWLCKGISVTVPVHQQVNQSCFNPQYTKLSTTKSKLQIDTKRFQADKKYVFQVTVSKEGREANYSQAITFISGNPPTVRFECVTNCATKWNNQEKIILKSQCPGCYDMDDIIYKWELLDDSNVAVKDVDQSKDPKYTLTGWNKESLVINPAILNQASTYSIRLSAHYKDSANRKTIITLTKKTSILPTSGACVLLPKEGHVAMTNFQVKCNGWTTLDLPIKYQYMTKTTSASSSPSASSLLRQDYPIWYAGSEPWNEPSILPLGDSAKNFTMEIIVRIYNVFGAFSELPPKRAKVSPVPRSGSSSAESAAVKAITESKPSTNDSSSLSQWAASAASILNSERQPTTSRPGATQAPDSADKIQELTNTRTNIIESLSKSDMDDISLPNLKQLGEALSAVTSKPDQLSSTAQDTGSKFVEEMAKKFASNEKRNIGAESLEQTSMAIMGPLSNLMEATTTASDSYLTEYEAATDTASTTAAPTSGMTTKPTPTTRAKIIKQAEQTRNNVKSYMSTLNLVSQRLLENKVVGEASMVTRTKSFEIALQKQTYSKLANATFNTGDPALGVALPDFDALQSGIRQNGSTLSRQAQISCQTTVMNKILRTWDLSNAKNSASSIQSLELRSEDFESLSVKNLTNDITIAIHNRQEKLKVSKIQLAFPGEMQIVEKGLQDANTPLLVEFGSPDASPNNFTVLIQVGEPATSIEYDIRLDITNQGVKLSKNTGNATSNSTGGSNDANSDAPVVKRNSYINVIDSKTVIMWNFKKFKYGNRENITVYFNFYYHGKIPSPVLIPNIYTFDMLEVARKRNYTMRTFSCSCLFWDAKEDRWAGNGCKVDVTKTTFNRTVCKCNHLTSFGGFFVKPNPIPPLTGGMFLQGYACFVAVASALLLFIVGLVFARRADKKDINKVGLCPLPDNKPDHHYLYQITVWTGMRREAGTTSNVYFILSGDNGDTDIRHLKDPDRVTFQRSSSDVFVFSTEHALGDLSHIRVWHDNSGGGWYLRKIVITDIQSDKTYQFLCNRWLAVDHDDGQVEMIAPVSDNEELKDFSYVFTTKTRNDLSDGHLWFSVYARPPRSPFTRVQRLSCCMSLLMTSMMASAMFYKRAPKPTPETANYAAGLTFTWPQIFVALVSTAITLPINVLIVTLFRSSKPKDFVRITKVRPSRSVSKASVADNNSIQSASTASQPATPELIMQQNSEIPLLERKNGKQSESASTKASEEKKKKERAAKIKKKESFLFPHWCVYIAWFLASGTIIASSVMVIIYGMTFGNSRSLDWLSSITLSAVSDILVIQPVKVIAIAVFFALVIRKVEDDQPDVEEKGKKLAQDEEWLHTHTTTSLGAAVDTMTLRPPDELKLSAMRELRYKERKMGAISWEILLYSFYVFVTLTISYSLREEQGYWQTTDIQEAFNLKVRTGETFPASYYQFTKVLSYNDFWPWAENVLLPTLFPSPWYTNSAYPQKTKEFPGKLYINDLNHKIVNGVRIRQVRVKHDTCTKTDYVKDIIKLDCIAPYGLNSEDESSSTTGNWSKTTEKRPKLTRSNQPWLYQTWRELDGYPFLAELTTYYGGGYTLDLFPRWNNLENIMKLKAKRWIDRHTRAILIEFALFNPSTNHFSMVTIVFEFAETGGCIHYHNIYTFKLYRYTTGYAFFTIVCEVLFLLLLLLYMYREIKEFWKLRSAYFTQFWNLIEVSINVLSIIAIGFYFYREKLANDLLKRLPSKQPNIFINFQFAAYCDQIFIIVVSLIVFFVSIKFVKLLRFNRRMSILADTLKDAWYPLGMFSIVMGIILLGSFLFATLVFGTAMYGYRNVLVTAATQISLLLGKFNFYEYSSTNRIIGPIFFFGYIVIVNWILINMFVSIINDSYEVVCKNLELQSNDYEIVDFVMDRFKEWVGFGKTKKSKIERNIRWESAKSKLTAMRAFTPKRHTDRKHSNTRYPNQSDNNNEELGGLAHSVYWHFTPTFDGSVVDRELDVQDVNKTVDRFIDCINLLYFEDSCTAEKMSKKVKQEISNADYFATEKELKL
eukprot:gene8988-9948_t